MNGVPADDVARAERVPTWLLALAAAAVALARIVDDGFLYLHWADRDLWRTAHLDASALTLGAELSYGTGARVPGGALQLLLAPPVFLSGSPAAAHAWMAGLDALGVVVLAVALRRLVGPWGAAVGAAWYVGSDATSETLQRLWNPGFEGLWIAVAVAVCVEAVRRDDARALPVAGLCIGVAMQLHLSALLTGLGLAIGVLWARVPGALRRAPWVVAAAIVPYVPYLIVDGVRGWPNTRSLVGPGQVRDLTTVDASGIGRDLSDVAHILGGSHTAEAFGWWAETRWGVGELADTVVQVALVGVALMLAYGAWSSQGPARRALRVVLPPVALALLYFLRSKSIDLGSAGGARYLFSTVPCLAVIAAIGAPALRRAVPAAARHVAGLGVLLGALLALTGAALQVAETGRDLRDWDQLRDVTADLQAKLEWAQDDVTARVLVLKQRGGVWAFDEAIADAYLLDRQGLERKADVTGPCAVLLDSFDQPAVPTELPDGAALGTLLGLDGPVVIRDEVPLAWWNRLLVYDHPDGRCPATFDQRYVATPAEAAGRDLGPREVGASTELPAPAPGVTRVAGVYDADAGLHPRLPRRVHVVVDLAWADGAVTATLHSNQLRGQAWNGGWYEHARLIAPTLVFDGPGGPHLLRLSDGPVGYRAAHTPLTASLPLPAGSWRVGLEGTTQPDVDDLPVPGREAPGVPVRLDLLDGWDVGGD